MDIMRDGALELTRETYVKPIRERSSAVSIASIIRICHIQLSVLNDTPLLHTKHESSAP